MASEGLGKLFDISTGIVNVDFNTAGSTGNRVSLKNAAAVTFVFLVAAAGSGTEDLIFDIQQATASSGGTSGGLQVVDHFYIKNATTLAGSETWTRLTQTAASAVTITGATYAAKQILVAIEVNASQLSDGYKYVSVNVADPGSVARVGSCLYILHHLAVARTPANLIAPLS